MNHFWKTLALSALLLAFWGTAADVARADPEKPAETPGERLARDLADLNSRLQRLETALKTFPLQEIDGKVNNLEMDVNNLKKGLELLANQVAALEAKIQANQRVMRALDPATRPTMGTIRLENRARVRATVVLDKVSYDVQPGETREIKNRPAGNFDYYVLAEGFGQISQPVTRPLVGGEVYTIYINP